MWTVPAVWLKNKKTWFTTNHRRKLWYYVTVGRVGKRLSELGRRTKPRDQIEPVLVPYVFAGQPFDELQHFGVQVVDVLHQFFGVFVGVAGPDEQAILDKVVVPDRFQCVVHWAAGWTGQKRKTSDRFQTAANRTCRIAHKHKRTRAHSTALQTHAHTRRYYGTTITTRMYCDNSGGSGQYFYLSFSTAKPHGGKIDKM